jgi:hypothetical protein
MNNFAVGNHIKMNECALKNHGNKYENKILVITHVCIAVDDFYKDDNENLYDLKRLKDDREVGFSLYEWEMQKI